MATSIWGATDRGSPSGGTRVPVDTSSSSAPGYHTITQIADFTNTNMKKRSISFSVISPTTGQQGGYVRVQVAGTITGWSIIANAGTATVKVWKRASGTTAPTSGDSINTSGLSLSTGTAIISTTTSDFTTTTVNADDMFAFELTAVSGVTRLQFQLDISVTT